MIRQKEPHHFGIKVYNKLPSQRIYQVMLRNLKQFLIISYHCIDFIFNWMFKSQQKLQLIVVHDIMFYISLYLLISYGV